MRASTMIAWALGAALGPMLLGALLAWGDPAPAEAAGPTAAEQRAIRALEGIERNTDRMAREIKRCR